MAQQRPDWTFSPTEWALLRDQLTTTSQPSLSESTQLSSYVLIALCSLSLLLHSCSVFLKFRKSKLSLGSVSLGYHQPNLSFILPLVFFLNATLNIVSISSLLSDAHRLKFKGHTLAIQQINYSLLLSAGILTIWALACGLPPMHIGVLGPPRHGGRWTVGRWRTIRASRFNLVGYTSILVVFLIPLPCAILSKKFTDQINELDDKLLGMVNQVLENVDQPAEPMIDRALKVINQLDQTSTSLFFHIRMLSAIHLFFTLVVLSCTILISVSILRKLRQDCKSSSPLRPLPSHQDACTKGSPIDDPIEEPKPVLTHQTTRNIPDIEPQLEQFGSLHSSNQSSFRNLPSSLTSDSQLLSSSLVDLDHSKKAKKYLAKIKFFLVFVSIVCLSFIILNFCILANLFKYPDEISIGDLSILKLEWSTWLWNGSMSPLIGFINCFILLRKNNNTFQKWSTPFSKFF